MGESPTVLDAVGQVQGVASGREGLRVEPPRDRRDDGRLRERPSVVSLEERPVVREDREIVDPVVDDARARREQPGLFEVVGKAPEKRLGNALENTRGAAVEEQVRLDLLGPSTLSWAFEQSKIAVQPARAPAR